MSKQPGKLLPIFYTKASWRKLWIFLLYEDVLKIMLALQSKPKKPAGILQDGQGKFSGWYFSQPGNFFNHQADI